MRYHFPELHDRGGEFLQRIIAAGHLTRNQMFIDLPDDFDWRGEIIKAHGKSPALPPIRVRQPGEKIERPTIIANQKPAHIAPPTKLEMATNFAGSMVRFAIHGFKTVSEEQYKARLAICGKCNFWDDSARFGLGKCNAPGCGCSRYKMLIAGEKCPIGKWGEEK